MSGGEFVTAAAKPLLVATVRPAGGWLRRRFRPDTSVAALDTAADELAANVARIERVRLDQLQVSYRTGMRVRFDDLARVEFGVADGTVLGSLDSVATFYLGLSGAGRLLVVGEPGSGKTVLALHLILELLDKRRTRSEPVPIRCNATAWDGETDFTDFLVTKLNSDYAVHKRVARALVVNGRILPVIDGLDEMDESGAEPRRAQAAVQRFNEPSWRGLALVVTCRAAVYQAIRATRGGIGIIGCQPVSVRPLTAAEISERVQTLLDEPDRISPQYASKLAPMLGELDSNPDGTLSTTLRTPWMLTLALAYLEGADPAAAAALVGARSSEAITELLFAAQIPTACAQQPGEPTTWTYSVPEVQRWMRSLAHHLSGTAASGGRTEIRLHQVWLLAGSRRTRRLHQLLVALAGGLALGLTVGLVFGPPQGLLFGLGGGVLCGKIGGKETSAPGRIVLVGRRNGATGVAWRTGLGFGLQVGLGAGLAVGFASDLRVGLAAGAGVGLLSGLFGLIVLPPGLRAPQHPSKEIHDDVKAGLTIGLVFGLASGLAVTLVAGWRAGSTTGLVAGLTAALASATATGRYGCAVLIFRRTGRFAPRPARFLEWATGTGLLRVTGSAYQLRHDTYRQWLTDHPHPRSAD